MVACMSADNSFRPKPIRESSKAGMMPALLFDSCRYRALFRE